MSIDLKEISDFMFKAIILGENASLDGRLSTLSHHILFGVSERLQLLRA
jgi:hypothetical protein